MNLEMPSAETTEHLRMLLLIVLGIMIVTIPVVAWLVVVKVKAQQRQRPVEQPEAGVKASASGEDREAATPEEHE